MSIAGQAPSNILPQDSKSRYSGGLLLLAQKQGLRTGCEWLQAFSASGLALLYGAQAKLIFCPDIVHPAVNARMVVLLQVLVAGVPCIVDAATASSTSISCRAPSLAGQILAEYWQLPSGTNNMPTDIGSYTKPGEALWRGFIRAWVLGAAADKRCSSAHTVSHFPALLCCRNCSMCNGQVAH
jgi:hypothetical protein